MPVSIAPKVIVDVRGARGENQADILRRTGRYGVLPTDTDDEAMGKLNAAAEAEAGKAAVSAATAEAAAGPTFASTTAGLAATADGASFAVDNGDGTVTVYLNDGGAAVEQRTLATTDYLAGPDGWTAIGTKRDELAMPEILDIVLKRQDFYPQTYGAAADGVTDDAVAIQTAIDKAYAARGRVMFEGDYGFASQVELSAVMGAKAGSRLTVLEDFDDTGVGTLARSALINKNLALAYDPDTALPIVIEDALEMVVRSTTSRQLLTLANVSRVELNAPKFWTETTARVDALLDFYACWRNVDVYAPDFANVTGASGGASAWVRNITTDGSDSENDAFGLRWHGGHVRHNTGDEALAVFGVHGATHDVAISKLLIEALDDVAVGERHSTLLSCFPLNNNGSPSVAQGDLYAAVYNVLFDNLTLRDRRFEDHVYRTGRSEDKFNPCHDIAWQGGRIEAKQATERTSHMMRHVPCVGENVVVNGVTAIADQAGQVVTYGALDFDLVTNSDITGKVDRAVARSVNPRAAAIGNKRLEGNLHGVDDCVRVEANIRIAAPAYPVQARSTLTYGIARNGLHILNATGVAAGVLVNSVGGTTSPAGTIDQNVVNATNTNAQIAANSGAIGVVDVLRNRGVGTGSASLPSSFRRIEGNDRFGTADPPARTVVLGDAAAALTAAPIQTVIHDAVLSADRSVSLPTTGVADGHVVEYIRLPAAGTTYTTSVTGAATGTASFTAQGGASFVRSNGSWKRRPVFS